MSDGSVTFNISLDAFLATAVSDGTWADVFQTAKVDDVATPASQIKDYGGRLWSNGIDDLFLASYQQLYKGVKLWSVADAAERDALGSDDDLAANDLLFKRDDQTVWYCVSVDGAAASTWASISSAGDVTGPAGATDNAIARFDGAGGKTLQNSLAILDDSGNLSGLGNITLSGTVDGVDVSATGASLTAHLADTANPHTTSLTKALAAGNVTGGTDLEVSAADALLMVENGAVPWAPVATKGCLWVKSTTPNTLYFTDDAGTDHLIGAASGGDVVGPGSATDNALCRFDGTTGKLIQNSTMTLTDGGDVTVNGSIFVTGNVDGRNVSADGTALDAHIADVANPHVTTLALALASGATTGGTGIEVSAADPLLLNENAAVPGGAPAAGKGTIWIRNDVPNTLVFTDDAGTDIDLTGAGAAGAPLANVLVAGNTTGGTDIEVNGTDNIVLATNSNIIKGADGSGAAGINAVLWGGDGDTNQAGGSASTRGGAGNGTGMGGSALITGGNGGATGSGGNAYVQGGSGGNNDGGWAIIQGGAAGGTTKDGGKVTITAGTSGNQAGGADVAIAASAGGTISGNGGDVSIAAGSASAGNGGEIAIAGGDSSSTGNSGGAGKLYGGAGGPTSVGGEAELVGGAGNTSGAGGEAHVYGGPGGVTGAGGAVEVYGGLGGATSGAGGATTVRSGNAQTSGAGGTLNVYAGQGVAGAGGTAYFKAGAASSGNFDGGNVTLESGQGSGTGDSGYVYIHSGTAGATGDSGNILLQAGTAAGGTVGTVRITDTDFVLVSSTVAHGRVTQVAEYDGSTTGPNTAWSLTLPDDSATWVEAKVVAMKTDGSARAFYFRRVGVYRDGGAATIQGSVDAPWTEESDATWDCTFDVNSNDVRLRVTGPSGVVNLRWRCTVQFQQVT